MSHRSVPEAGLHARASRLAITVPAIRVPVASTIAAAGANDRGACAR